MQLCSGNVITSASVTPVLLPGDANVRSHFDVEESSVSSNKTCDQCDKYNKQYQVQLMYNLTNHIDMDR